MSQPITDKESSDGEDGRFKYGTTAMQGWRTNMEVRERRGIDRRRRRTRPTSRRRPRVANGEISIPLRADARPARERFPAAAARSPDPSLCQPALTKPNPGLRPQDAHATILGLDDNTAFFGVYDGHGGKEVRPPPAPCSIASDVAERRLLFSARVSNTRASVISRPAPRFVARDGTHRESRRSPNLSPSLLASCVDRARERRRRNVSSRVSPRTLTPNPAPRPNTFRWPSTFLGTCTRCSRSPRRTSAAT